VRFFFVSLAQAPQFLGCELGVGETYPTFSFITIRPTKIKWTRMAETTGENRGHWSSIGPALNEMNMITSEATPKELEAITRKTDSMDRPESFSHPPLLSATLRLVALDLPRDRLKELPSYVREHPTSVTFPEKVRFANLLASWDWNPTTHGVFA
jgi:hypothetical protein